MWHDSSAARRAQPATRRLRPGGGRPGGRGGAPGRPAAPPTKPWVRAAAAASAASSEGSRRPRREATIRRTCSFSAAPVPVTARLTSAGVTSAVGTPRAGEGEEEDAARLAERDEALGIDAREDPLHGGVVGRASGRRRRASAVVKRRGGARRTASPTAGRRTPAASRRTDGLEGHERPPRRAAAGIDAEDPHAALSVRGTCRRCRRSTRPSGRRRGPRRISRSFRSAGPLSPTAIVLCGTIWISAVWSGDPLRLDLRLDLLEGRRVREDLEDVRVLGLEVLGAALEGQLHERVLLRGALLDGDVALLVELERDRAGRGHVAAVLREEVADLGGRPVLVVRHRLDQDRGAAGAVALVDDLLVGDALELARAALDRLVDVVGRHRRLLRRQDGGAEARVRVDDAAADLGGHRDFLDQLREEAAALGVGGALLVLDRAPLAVSGHGSPRMASPGAAGPRSGARSTTSIGAMARRRAAASCPARARGGRVRRLPCGRGSSRAASR